MPDPLKSNVKSFADDISLFSVVKNKEVSASDLTNDLDMISKWSYNWKMSFNLDPKKPAQEVLFSEEKLNITRAISYFNNVQVRIANQQNHSGIILDDKLNFKCHIDKLLAKTSKGIVIIKIL